MLKKEQISRFARWSLICVALVGSFAAAAKEVVIAQIAPLSGVLASTGRQMVLGGQIYFDWINDQGGVHGARIRTVVLDDGYRVDDTVRHARDLIDRPEVVALFGLAGTANIGKLLADDVLAQGRMPVVAPYTGGDILRTPFNPWIFHVRAGYVDETEHMVKQLETLGIRRIAVFYQDDAFGKSGLQGAEAALKRRGLEMAASAGYERNTTNVDEAVKTILASQAQAVIMIAVNKPAAAFIKQYRAAGGGGLLFNISVVDPAELVKLAGLKEVRGLGISQVVPFPYQPNLPVVREFQQMLKKYAPDEGINYTNFEEYLGAKVLVEGLRRAGPNPTRARLMTALESLRNFDLGGITVSYGPQERIGSRYVEITVIGADGKLRR